MFKDIMKPEEFIKKMTNDIDSCNFGGGKISSTDAWRRFLYGKNGNKDAPDEISVCHPLFELYRNLYSLNSEKHAVYACSLIGSTPLNFICHRKQNEGEPEQKELFDAMFNHERYTTLKMNFRTRFEENINIFIGVLDDKLKSLHLDKDPKYVEFKEKLSGYEGMCKEYLKKFDEFVESVSNEINGLFFQIAKFWHSVEDIGIKYNRNNADSELMTQKFYSLVSRITNSRKRWDTTAKEFKKLIEVMVEEGNKLPDDIVELPSVIDREFAGLVEKVRSVYN